jgi:hypothetical protein
MGSAPALQRHRQTPPERVDGHRVGRYHAVFEVAEEHESCSLPYNFSVTCARATKDTSAHSYSTSSQKLGFVQHNACARALHGLSEQSTLARLRRSPAVPTRRRAQRPHIDALRPSTASRRVVEGRLAGDIAPAYRGRQVVETLFSARPRAPLRVTARRTSGHAPRVHRESYTRVSGPATPPGRPAKFHSTQHNGIAFDASSRDLFHCAIRESNFETQWTRRGKMLRLDENGIHHV